MLVPLLDLKAQYNSIRGELDKAVLDVMGSGNFVLGPNVRALEEETAAYVGVRHAVGVASGTDALLLTLRALGVGPDDEVIVPAYTFFGTASAVLLLGARPVLVDIEPETYCIDVDGLEERITPRTKAIIPVHLFGHPADMDPIQQLAREHNLSVVEDNAQAIGATYKGQMTGGLGNAGCLSFYPSKNLGAYGDGGMVLTDDDELADQLMMLRTHGWKRKYYSETVGYNSRLDELQAAVLRVKLAYLDGWNERRRDLAKSYGELLMDLGIGVPQELEYARHVYHLYVIEVNERQSIIEELGAAGVATAIYYPYPLHMAPAMADLGYKAGDFPIAERTAQRCLAIPLYPEMAPEHLEHVAGALQEIIPAASPA